MRPLDSTPSFARRACALALCHALALLPAVPAQAAPAAGRLAATFSVSGRPAPRLAVALVDLERGHVVRGVTDASGRLRLGLAAGSYALMVESKAPLVVSRGPRVVRVAAAGLTRAQVELLLAGALTAAPQQGQAQITHEAAACFLAEEFPLLTASVEPAAPYTSARIYFRPARATEFFYVEMEAAPEGGFQGRLPRPRLEASPIEYYVAFLTTDGEEVKSETHEVKVVENESACAAGRLAALGGPGEVTVYSAATGAAVAPAGFAAGSLALTAGTVAALVSGAAAAGISAAVTVTNPVPTPVPTPVPSVTPTPTPRPTPSPSPTPTPTPEPTPSPTPSTASK